MIKKIQFDSSKLGKLLLDFTKPNGDPYEVIVLAGENGCGKTSILEAISSLFQRFQLGEIDNITYSINGHTVYLVNKKYNRIEHFSIDDSMQKSPIALNLTNDIKAPYNICTKSFAYSKARSGFQLMDINTISAKDVDDEKKDFDGDDYTDIKQLLIDIDSIDDKNYKKFSQSNPNLLASKIQEEFDKVSRMSRFKNAFNSFFESLKFDGVGEPINNSFPIIFKKNNKAIDINDLSTGEKQIVLRGGRLLKNAGNMDDGIVLIDEPELSLHPQWQRKILDYYCDLFKKNSGLTAQIIMATHSEYVVESALKKSNCLVIILKDNKGTIESENIIAPDILGTITSSEINYKAFNVYSIDYHNALYSVYQHQVGTESSILETDNKIFESCFFDSNVHLKVDTYGNRTYRTLPTYIRNEIDHPNNNRTYSYSELIDSTELLRKLCNQ